MRLCTIREREKISQAELAKRIGVSQGAVSHWEKGIRQPRADQVRELAKVLNCTTDELLREEA